MANIQEKAEWVENIYELQFGEKAIAGPDGVANRQAKQLANRTQYLKGRVDKALRIHELLAKYHHAPHDAKVRAQANVDIQAGRLLAIDGVELEDGDIVLLTEQTDKTENGLFLAHESSPWTRHPDYSSGQAFTHLYISVLEGSDAGKLYTIKNEVYEIGVTELEFFETALSPKKLPCKIIIRDRNGNFEGAGSGGGEEIHIPYGFAEFLNNDTFIVPAGVNELVITACGAGGGGAGNKVYNTFAGSGGGGDAIYKKKFKVTPGSAMQIVIGASGPGGGQIATSGGSTIIGNLITLPGGEGGKVIPNGQLPTGGAPGGPGAGKGGLECYPEGGDGILGLCGKGVVPSTGAGKFGGGGSLGGGGAVYLNGIGGTAVLSAAEFPCFAQDIDIGGGNVVGYNGQNGKGPNAGAGGVGINNSLIGGAGAGMGAGGGACTGDQGSQKGGGGGGGYVLIEWGEAA